MKRTGLWVDDYAAIGSALVSVCQLFMVFFTPDHAGSFGVPRYYILICLFYTILWSSRISTTLSIIRIARAALQEIRHLFWTIGLFVVFWLLLVLQFICECEMKKSWKADPIPKCDFNIAIPACQIITDAGGDAILMVFSLQLFTAIQERKLRTRLGLAFATCMITTLASIPHLSSTSLIVCNFPFLFTAVFKLQEPNEPPASPDDIPNIDFGAFFQDLDVTTTDSEMQLVKTPSELFRPSACEDEEAEVT
ncbi:hypothetical protein NP233_g3847 [Leucocoprinus birnbaumii]|uniref:Uncharacterized protein n=1 Tax=Leucocoprinus birnbaumii TaxID=56174 RepID=A0AAD5VWI0_9AGAR|nr:hypothetical protein NP233_g3847 [Leucocoprinus birnbaumii]